MVLTVMALFFAFTIVSVSAQNAPKEKKKTEKTATEKSDKASTDSKDAKSGCESKSDAHKSGCATPCSGEKAKSCCSKGAHSDAAKPVPAPEKK